MHTQYLVQTSVLELCILFSVFENNGNSLRAESGSVVGLRVPGAVKNGCSVISVKSGRDSGLFCRYGYCLGNW